jgi:hypothetical protein
MSGLSFPLPASRLRDYRDDSDNETLADLDIESTTTEEPQPYISLPQPGLSADEEAFRLSTFKKYAEEGKLIFQHSNTPEVYKISTREEFENKGIEVEWDRVKVEVLHMTPECGPIFSPITPARTLVSGNSGGLSASGQAPNGSTSTSASVTAAGTQRDKPSFETVTIHTAKCDVCSHHNTSILYRCLTCGWSVCKNCFNTATDEGSHGCMGKTKLGGTSSGLGADLEGLAGTLGMGNMPPLPTRGPAMGILKRERKKRGENVKGGRVEKKKGAKGKGKGERKGKWKAEEEGEGSGEEPSMTEREEMVGEREEMEVDEEMAEVADILAGLSK